MGTRVTIFDGRLDSLVESALVEMVDSALDAGVTSAKRLVPVDTGELHDGIKVTDPAHVEAGAVVGAYGVENVEHAEHVEFGTSIMAAQPYLRPSVDAMKGRLR